MSEPTAQASTVIEASREAVWEALTDPDLVREYFMGTTVVTDWKLGSPITFSGEWGGKSYTDKGEILDLEPAARLAFSHWSPMSGTPDAPEHYHVVEIALGDEGGNTAVTLTQSNLRGGITDSDHANRDEYEKTWAAVLSGLKQTVETRATRSSS